MLSNSTSSISYNISDALCGLGERDVRRKGEQHGTVRRKGKSWYISFKEWRADESGNLKYRLVERKIDGEFGYGQRAKKQAATAGYDQWVAKANSVTKVPQGLATVQQFYETRFQMDHVDQLKKSGRIHYKTMWTNHILPTLGQVQMRDVTPQMVQALVSAKIHAGFSPQTIYHLRNCISAIFRHARNLRFHDGALPTEGVSLPELTHKERMALTWDQVKMLADAMPKYRDLVIVLSQTGMRIGEACGLRWKHVNLKDEWQIVDNEALPPNTLLVCSNWTKGERTTTKNRSWRKIPLTAEAWVALTLLSEMSKFSGPDQPVFASRNGTPLDAHNVSSRALKKAALKIGMPWVSFHCLRHTASTLADKAGLTVAEKQKILGHRTADMATHYTHPEIEHVRQAMEQMTSKTVN
jgi:integrase